MNFIIILVIITIIIITIPIIMITIPMITTTTIITMITTSGHLPRTNGSVSLHREQQDPALGQQEDHPDR